MNKVVKEKLNQGLVLLIIVVAFVISLTIMLKYKTEGEQNMPFTLKKILIISSAEAVSKPENPENQKWNIDINQYNDIYIEVQKNDNYKREAYIEEIKIENIQIENPIKGQISLYMPNSTDGNMFSYEDNLKINNSLTYKGANENDTKKLTIANQGGTVLFRAVNEKVGEYISNNDDELAYDGTLLEKTNVNMDEIKFKVKFDLVIKTENNKYRGSIKVDLPYGEINKEGVCRNNIENVEDIVFKRESN